MKEFLKKVVTLDNAQTVTTIVGALLAIASAVVGSKEKKKKTPEEIRKAIADEK